MPRSSQPSTRADCDALRYVFRNVQIVGGGFVTGLVAHPRERGLMYARTDVGGAYRFDAADARWTPITDWIGGSRWPYTGVESVAVDPREPTRVYLALGIYNQARFGRGAIARSNDRGRTWALSELPLGMGGNEAGRGGGERLAVDPNCGSRLFFGSRDRGLWRSDDQGATWSHVESFPHVETALPNPTPERWNYLTQAVGIVFVLFDPLSGGEGSASRHLYAAVSTRAESLFESRDGGASWAALAGQPTGLRPIRAALAKDGTLYITYGREPGPNTMFEGAVFKYRPDSRSWSDITPLVPDPEHGHPFGYAGIAVDAANPQRVLCATAYRDHAQGSGGDELFLSLDGGRSWRALGQAARRDSALAPWLTFGRESAHFGHWVYALVIDPFDPDRAYYGTGQTIWGTANLGHADRGELTDWRVCALGIEETVPLSVASPSQGAELLVGTGDISGFAVFDVGDARRHVALHEPTFKDTSSIDFAELEPTRVVRVGSQGWNREKDRDRGAFSEDGGLSWTAFPSYPEPSAQLGRIAIAADGKRWLWQPRALDTYLSVDSGRSWRPCDGLPDRECCVLSDRVDPSLFYALPRQGDRLYLSYDGGAHFQPSEQPLPARGLADAQVEFSSRGSLWAVLDGALFHSPDAGTSWQAVSVPGRVSHVGLGRSQHADGVATVFVVAELDATHAFLRSGDRGRNWQRLNDDQQQFGQIRVITGDPKRFGRLYVGTGGRGLLYADPR